MPSSTVPTMPFRQPSTGRATPLTVSKTGEVVSAVYGFALMLLKVLSELKPTHYAIAFDKKGPYLPAPAF